MTGRTIVVVTHHLDLLLSSNRVDEIIEMENGTISHRISPENSKINEPTAIQAVDEGLAIEQVGSKEQRKVEFKRLVKEEVKASGGVGLSTYWLYAKASSWSVWLGVILMLALGQGLTIASRYWLKYWGEAYQTAAIGVELGFRPITSLLMATHSLAARPHWIPL